MQLQVLGMGMLMGVAFAAPPGAVTAETFRRGVRGGFALALGVQLGSLVGDAAYALLALAGLAALAQNPTLGLVLGGLGALFLIYLAWTSFKTALSPAAVLLPSHTGGTPHARVRLGAFASGMALSLTNPWAIVFWLSLGGALASLGLGGGSERDTAAFFVSFMAGSALWAVILALGIGWARTWIRPAVFRAVSVLCGVALGAFGLISAGRVLSSVFGISL